MTERFPSPVQLMGVHCLDNTCLTQSPVLLVNLNPPPFSVLTTAPHARFTASLDRGGNQSTMHHKPFLPPYYAHLRPLKAQLPKLKRVLSVYTHAANSFGDKPQRGWLVKTNPTIVHFAVSTWSQD